MSEAYDLKEALDAARPSHRLAVMRAMESQHLRWLGFWRTWRWVAFGAGVFVGVFVGVLVGVLVGGLL